MRGYNRDMKKYLPISIMVVIGIAIWAAVNSGSREVANTDHQPINEQVKDAVFADLSLPAFAKQKLVGSDFTMGEVQAETATYTRYFITYKSDGLKISGIMNVPKGGGPFPVVFLNHGYIDPAIYTNGRGLRREQDFFARNGYVVVHSDYRNHAQSDKAGESDVDLRLGYTAHVINAVTALKAANFAFVDPNRIGMMGHSMGGGITMNILTTKPDLVGAAILYAPVSYDTRDNFNKWIRVRPNAKEILEKYGEPDANPKFWDNISPMTYLDKIAVPVMVHQGINDKETPIEWADKFVRSMEEKKKEITYHTYVGEGHEFAGAWGTVMQRSLEFLNQNL